MPPASLPSPDARSGDDQFPPVASPENLGPAGAVDPWADQVDDPWLGQGPEDLEPDRQAIARWLAQRTGLSMNHGLQMARRTAALVAGVRPALPASMYATLGARADGHDAAPLPVAGLPARDGAARVGVMAAMDGQNRVCIAKAAGALGWDDHTHLVVVCELGRLTVSQGLAGGGREAVARYRGGRLTLSPAARGCLGLVSGDQVVASTEPAGASMVLLAGADVLQMLTGTAATASLQATPVALTLVR